MLLYKKQFNKHTRNDVQDEVYYDIVGPHLPPPKLERNVACEEKLQGSTAISEEKIIAYGSSTVVSEVEKNIAYGVYVPKIVAD